MAVENRHTNKLKEMIKDEITVMFEQTLDFCQVACPVDNFKQLRSKILRVGNNCIRNLHKKIEDQYKIEYVPSAEDVIEIQRRK